MALFVGRKIRTSESLELFQTFPLSLVLDSLGGGTLPSTLWCVVPWRATALVLCHDKEPCIYKWNEDDLS